MLTLINAENPLSQFKSTWSQRQRWPTTKRKVQSGTRGNVENLPALEVIQGDNIIANRFSFLPNEELLPHRSWNYFFFQCIGPSVGSGRPINFWFKRNPLILFFFVITLYHNMCTWDFSAMWNGVGWASLLIILIFDCLNALWNDGI